MRFGDKCKEKSTKMTDDNNSVTDLINNANFLLNVSPLLTRQNLLHVCFIVTSNVSPIFRISIDQS